MCEGYGTCLVCMCVCLLTTILVLYAMKQLLSDIKSFSGSSAKKYNGDLANDVWFKSYDVIYIPLHSVHSVTQCFQRQSLLCLLIRLLKNSALPTIQVSMTASYFPLSLSWYTVHLLWPRLHLPVHAWIRPKAVLSFVIIYDPCLFIDVCPTVLVLCRLHFQELDEQRRMSHCLKFWKKRTLHSKPHYKLPLSMEILSEYCLSPSLPPSLSPSLSIYLSIY